MSTVSRITVPFIALALVGAPACEKSSEPSPEPEAPAATTEKADPPGAARSTAAGHGRSSAPVVTLLEAGDEPRKVLQFDLEAGMRSQFIMVMKMTMRMNIDGNTPPAIALPDMRVHMSLEITEASEAGYGYRFVIDKYEAVPSDEVDQAVFNAIAAQFKLLDGLKGQGKIDRHGRNLGATIDIPATVPAQVAQLLDGMRDAMARLSAPLPLEPVGVGARWHVDMTMVQNGMASKLRYTYHIKAMDGQRIDLDFAVKITGVPGPIVNDAVPAGTKMHLVSTTGQGVGLLTLDLGQIVPTHSEVTLGSTAAMTVEAGGQKQHMETTTDISMSINPRR